MSFNYDLVKEYINTKFGFRNRIEEINSITVQKISPHSNLKFFLLEWSGWRIQADGKHWTYKTDLKSLRFNVEDYNTWLSIRRDNILNSLE